MMGPSTGADYGTRGGRRRSLNLLPARKASMAQRAGCCPVAHRVVSQGRNELAGQGARFAGAASLHLRQQGVGQGVGDLLAVLGGFLGHGRLRRIQAEQGIDCRHVHELELDQAGAAGLG